MFYQNFIRTRVYKLRLPATTRMIGFSRIRRCESMCLPFLFRFARSCCFSFVSAPATVEPPSTRCLPLSLIFPLTLLHLPFIRTTIPPSQPSPTLSVSSLLTCQGQYCANLTACVLPLCVLSFRFIYLVPSFPPLLSFLGGCSLLIVDHRDKMSQYRIARTHS